MASWQENARTEFDAWSASYDRSLLQRLFFRPSHDAVLAAAPMPNRARVLDVGCGTGLFARRLLHAHPTAEVVGLDLSEAMLDKARANCRDVAERLELVAGDSQRLPFADAAFDLVTCIHSFHHYPDQPAVAAEMFRVLRPGGAAVIVDGDRDGWWGWFVFDGVVTAIERHVHHCSAPEFAGLLQSAGFFTVAHQRVGGLAPFLVTCGTRRAEAAVQPRRAAA